MVSAHLCFLFGNLSELMMQMKFAQEESATFGSVCFLHIWEDASNESVAPYFRHVSMDDKTSVIVQRTAYVFWDRPILPFFCSYFKCLLIKGTGINRLVTVRYCTIPYIASSPV